MKASLNFMVPFMVQSLLMSISSASLGCSPKPESVFERDFRVIPGIDSYRTVARSLIESSIAPS